MVVEDIIDSPLQKPARSVFSKKHEASGDSGGGNPPFDGMIFSVNTANTSFGSSNSDQFELKMFGRADFTVDWGDGNSEASEDDTLTHTYSSSGVYEIRISGTDYSVNFDNTGDLEKITDISQWGDNVINSDAFYGCLNLDVSATDTPTCVNLSNAFRNCTSLVGNASFNNWNTSSVTSIASCFNGASSFNAPIGGWNISGVSGINAGSFLSGCSDFNQDVSGFNISNITSLFSFFSGCSSFNQDLTSWDFSAVTEAIGFLDNTSMSVSNYDNLLVELDSQTLQSFVLFGAFGLSYTSAGAAGTARTSITTNDSWLIFGDTGI